MQLSGFNRIASASVLYCLGFLAWVIVTPGSEEMNVAGNNILGIVGPAALSILVLIKGFPVARKRISDRPAPALLALGILLFALGDGIWAFYEVLLGRPTPFPSWADVAYLASYPILMLGIIATPVGRRSIVPRVRLVLDGAMLVLIASAVSWFFLIGPTIEAGGASLLEIGLSVGYPLGDLMLVVCLVLLWLRAENDTFHHAFGLVSAGLLLTILADSVFAYLELQGGYQTGYIFTDVGWVAGYVLIALGALVLQLRPPSIAASDDQSRRPAASHGQIASLPRLLLPYVLLPIVAALFLYSWFTAEDSLREAGVVVLSAGLLAVIILRQVMAMIDNQHLQVSTMMYAERLEQLATTDPLTELPNHRALMMALEHEIERAERYERQFSVLFIDLDHFKAINDTFGHPTGDTLLKEVAIVIRGCVRNVDYVGRWGGEEFLAILPEADSAAAGVSAERIRSAIASRIFAIGGGLHITCSIGAATTDFNARDRDELIALADEALYAAKRLGRNQTRSASDPATVAMIGDSVTHDPREAASMLGMVEALTRLVAARDQYTSRHSHDVGTLATRVAVALGLTASEAQMLSQAGQLHDIGKVAIPDAILRKPGPLTSDEWAITREHAAVSAEVVSHVPTLRHIAPIVRSHHERMDGTGYPDGLSGDDIPLGARILAVVDSYTAITTDRPYRSAQSSTWALAELRRSAGTQFDPNVVAALERVLAADPVVMSSRPQRNRHMAAARIAAG